MLLYEQEACRQYCSFWLLCGYSRLLLCFSHQMVFLAQVSRILLITLQKLLTRILNMYSLPLILCLQLSLISHSYEGLDQKIKKKRSVGAVGNRVMTGERDVKRYALPKANADSKMRFYETQGFRLKPLPGSSGINNSRGSSEPSTWGV
ncbi:uncharacterized protein [Arachis hypogaea]|uniref:uncharacterized protein isoform X2 n=1 Tax=Arachis hypogaea TaxID=3818 RepID=UPI003B214D71